MAHRIGIDARKLQDFGIGTYIRQLLEHLCGLDQDDEYVIFARPQDEQRLERLPSNFTVVCERAPGYSLRELVSLSWRISKLRLDLYHATHYVLPAVVRCPSIVTIHDIIHLLFPELLPNRLAVVYARTMIRRSLTSSDRVIAVSKNTKQDLTDTFKVDADKIEVIYNGVAEVFRQQLEPSQIDRWMKRLELEPGYLLFVGNPKPHKNLDRVLRAFALARERLSNDTLLVCVGGRTDSDLRIRSLAESLGIGARTRFLGHVAEEALPAVYQAAALFLYPTLYEGFGLPVVEAMASRVPIVTSNTSALREIAEGYAHLVSPIDVQQIADAIVHCMTDEEHRSSLAKLGRRRSEDFSWQAAAERTLDLYRQVLGASGPES